jgi:ribonuclease III, bacterial
MENKNVKELEEKIGYEFQELKLLKQAMTHSSFSNENKLERLVNNERLEFLGDAVLEVISSEFLFEKYPQMLEGDLTKLRASIVCEPTLATCARTISLGKFLFLGKGEHNTGGRNRDSIISDALEAVIGAIYLDGGFASAKEFILKFILTDIEDKHLFYDSKTILQEIIQGEYSGNLTYVIIEENGPDHNKEFKVNALLGEKIVGTGKGRTKKAAEQQAAYQAILDMKKSNT